MNYGPFRVFGGGEEQINRARAAYICDRDCGVARDGIMAPPKLGRKIFLHLTDAFQRWLIILTPVAFHPVGEFLGEILQRLQIVGIVDRVFLVLCIIADGGTDRRSEDQKRQLGWEKVGVDPRRS